MSAAFDLLKLTCFNTFMIVSYSACDAAFFKSNVCCVATDCGCAACVGTCVKGISAELSFKGLCCVISHGNTLLPIKPPVLLNNAALRITFLNSRKLPGHE